MIDFSNILYLLFPKRCAVCNKVIHISYDFCSDCYKTLRPLPEHYAQMFMANPLAFKKRNEKIYFDGVTASFFHSDGSRDLIYNYKFKNRSELSKLIGISMSNTFTKYLADKEIDYICSVPTTFFGRLQRGFDHTARIAIQVSKNTSLPYEKLLKQAKHKKTQHKLNAVNRAKNVKGVYRFAGNCDIKNKNIVIIDDIISTSSTVNECAKILKNAGAAKVYCLACNLNV